MDQIEGNAENHEAALKEVLNNPECLNILGKTIKFLQSNLPTLNWEGFLKVLKITAKALAVIIVGVTICVVAVIFIQWLLSFPIISSAVSVILLKLKIVFTHSWDFYLANQSSIHILCQTALTPACSTP